MVYQDKKGHWIAQRQREGMRFQRYFKTKEAALKWLNDFDKDWPDEYHQGRGKSKASRKGK